ncbi:beta-galactosidase [Pseudactinotalea sp. Z1739]|uniref:beta-galactosidase n=1 Tax=Pseudactinotalea sp. Z1739 TaxID=3413028 RepID=UPI003C7A912C
MPTDTPVPARTARHLRVTAPRPPRRGHPPMGSSPEAPDRIEVTGRWLERGGRPWFPVTGEVHYARLPRERWSQTLGHARAGGLTSVACYVLWQAHEPDPGRFRWDGNRDLRAFIDLARRHGLEVIVRMGPWAHGEARYGGFPDWLIAQNLPTRTNDPAYLELARRLYAQVITQLTGLTHAEGGPVVGVQIENELYDQPEHLATLRRIAEDLGLQVPIWTVTGWGGAEVPGTLLPVYSAYADGFWAETTTEWPPFAQHHFRYGEVRDDLTVGADLREALDGITGAAAAPRTDAADLPFATCELGGGMHVAYHRRPLVSAQDVTALALAKIGSGSIWQGYYMYAGGTQRAGAAGPEQESHATGYPNDVPTRSYDFNAPIGEHGQIRAHHHTLRRQHLWLATDGTALATMTTSIGGGSEDPEELRWAVRSDGRRGYLFCSTYQPPKQPIAAQPGFRVSIEFDDDVVNVPAEPVDLPRGISVAWPVRYPLTDHLRLRSATAELLTRISDDAGEVVVLSATEGVPVELVLERTGGREQGADDGDIPVGGAGSARREGAATVVTLDAPPGPETVVDLPGIRVVVLDEQAANRLYRLDLGGRDRLVLADVPVYALDGQLVADTEVDSASISVLPAPAALQVAPGTWGSGPTAPTGAATQPGVTAPPALLARDSEAAHGSLWATWRLSTLAVGTLRIASDLSPTAPSPPAPRTGGPMNRLSAPTDFSGAAAVPVRIPGDLLEDVDRALLRVNWTGDVGRAVIDGQVVSDNFWHGRVWDIDLTEHREVVTRQGLELELLPWRAETGVWVDPAVRDVADGISVTSVDLVRVARVALSLPD